MPAPRLRFGLSFVCFFSLLCASYVLRPMRDALGIEGGVHVYHWLFSGTFAVTLVLYPALGALASRATRTGFATGVFATVAASLVGFRILLDLDIDETWLSRAFFIWVSVFNVLLTSVFWSAMADVFTREEGKRQFGPIAAGGTAGALVGPLATRELVGHIDVSGMLLVAAGLIAVALGCLVALRGSSAGAREEGDPVIGGAVLDGVARVVRSSYLVVIAGYVLLLTTTATVVYFQQGWIVEDAITDRAGRTELFATVDLCTNLFTLFLQLVAARWVMRRGSVGAALVVLPLVTAGGMGVLAASPALLALVLFQVARRSSEYGLARPAREVLFTGMPREDKFKAKNVIDVAIYRGGDAAAAWAVWGLTAAAGVGVEGAALAALPLCAVWIALAMALGRRERNFEEKPA